MTATATLNDEIDDDVPITDEKPVGYTFFNAKLATTAYALGDLYDGTPLRVEQDWELKDGVDRPYLKHVKLLSNSWPNLRLLANFMEVSTTPLRWERFQKGENQKERRERAERTNVTRLDYLASGEVLSRNFDSSATLKSSLEKQPPGWSDKEIKLRLFVVEDLSRDVIENLGANLDIEPAFFREHIVDYAWYNTRDRWVDPPNLEMVSRRQRWFQIRYVSARYFQMPSDFQEGVRQAERFNVLRRPDDDRNNNARWDKETAIVAITRSRASFWLKRPEGPQGTAIGVLLLDPTIKAGFPLWRGYRNWEETPSRREEVPPGPPWKSIFGDFLYWAQRPDSFRLSRSQDPTQIIYVPLQALLHLVCAEWLTMANYIKTRLGQVDWEIAFPQHFLQQGATINDGLQKLHMWRRLVPLYREMLSETLERVFCYPWDSTDLFNGTCECKTCTSYNDSRNTTGDALGLDDSMAITTTNGNDATSAKHKGIRHCAGHDPAQYELSQIGVYRADFARVLSYLEEYQSRIDRLTTVVAAVITIKDSRRGLEDNRNLARLTLLGFLYIPLSFVSSLFSMQPDIPSLGDTMKWYFAGALPLAIVSLTLAWIVTQARVKRFGVRVFRKLGLPIDVDSSR